MNRNSTSDEQTLKNSTFISSNARGMGRRRGYRGNRDGGSKDGNVNFRTNGDYDKSRGRDFDKSNVECYRCHKFGHYRSECCTRLPNEKEEKSNFVENKEGETLLMPIHAETRAK
uniref:CCHC-type domain-containing protein n=1 Tax=Solanum tuberosum TaxID=4113 RepID=M1A8Q6_SOLTU